MIINRELFILPLLLSCLACWEHQEHDILLPETPHYTLSGYTVDIDDTTLVLPQTPVSLMAYMLLYDATFNPVSVQSDSNGYFQIESVIPGDYFLAARRDGYLVFSKPLSMSHHDRVLNLELPSPLVNDFSYVSTASLTGLITFADGVLMALGVYPISDEVDVPAILKLGIDHGRVIATGYYPVDDLDADVFGYAGGLFYLCKHAHVTVLSSIDGSVVADWVADEPLRGLTWTGSGFWTTLGPSLQYRGENLRTVETSYETSAGRLGPLACCSSHFWSYDTYRGLILKLDNQGNVLASYRPLDSEGGRWIDVDDMDSDAGDRLWVSSKQGRLYVFQVGQVKE